MTEERREFKKMIKELNEIEKFEKEMYLAQIKINKS